MAQKVIWHPNMAPSFLLLHIITNEKSLKFTQIGRLLRLPRFPAETRSNNSGRYTCWYIYLDTYTAQARVYYAGRLINLLICFSDSKISSVFQYQGYTFYEWIIHKNQPLRFIESQAWSFRRPWLWSHIDIPNGSLASEPCSTAGPFFPSQCPYGTIFPFSSFYL